MHRSNEPIASEDRSYPYYGGLAGHYFQPRGQRDGIVNTYISPQVASTRLGPGGGGITVSSHIEATSGKHNFEQDFNKIQVAAAQLVAIQEMAKRKGSFSAEDNKIYADSLLELGQAAQNLAKLQQSGQIKDFSVLLQTDGNMPQKQPITPSGVDHSSISDLALGEQKVDEVTEQHFSEDDLLPPNNENPYEDVHDSVSITAPKKDASVAEAKPVGLSIAGEGGVASSKPSAVALSGRNGLAVASPKATAIAGVSPEEAAAFSIALPNQNQLVIKSSQAANRLTRPVYDDYDYSDLAPVRPLTRDTPLTRDAHLRTPTGPTSEVGDAFVNKWKTLIAEDYSAAAERSASASPGKHQLKSNVPNRFAVRERNGRTFFIF